jgi:Outer membrane lipoprotein-sorting protein
MYRCEKLLCSLVVGLALGSGALAHALDPATTDAKVIAKAAEDQDRGDRQTATVTLTLIDPKGNERVRKLRQLAMKFDGGRKTLMFFESPADVRNTGFLSLDYDAGDRDDDQWLYLPNLHKTTRITNVDRSRSFMGTDITYADMTKKDPERYEYRLVEASVKVDGEDCWVIEARPRSEDELEATGYVKSQAWISKSKLLPLQGKMWINGGKKLKYVKTTDIRQVDGVWIGHKTLVRTVSGTGELESTTRFELSDVRFDQPSVTPELFTERRLEQGL